jgi:hypothetical protein
MAREYELLPETLAIMHCLLTPTPASAFALSTPLQLWGGGCQQQQGVGGRDYMYTRIWSSSGRQKVEHGLLVIIYILWVWRSFITSHSRPSSPTYHCTNLIFYKLCLDCRPGHQEKEKDCRGQHVDSAAVAAAAAPAVVAAPARVHD